MVSRSFTSPDILLLLLLTVDVDNWTIDENTISNQSECFCGETVEV